MRDKTLTLLISTYNERIKSLQNVLAVQKPHIRYIIVHQVDNNKNYDCFVAALISKREDINYSLMKSTGVTKSRNFAMSQVEGDYALFMDDDVRLADNFYNIIVDSFEKHPTASVLTFQAGDINTGKPLKNYRIKEQFHTKISILKVGTIEIAFKIESVKTSGVLFPEHLGAGTPLAACDEPVFLARLMAKGLKLAFIPKTIVLHQKESSGKAYQDENSLICRGVAFREIFGRFISIPVIILFYLKNRHKFQLKKQSAFLALYKGYLMTKFK